MCSRTRTLTSVFSRHEAHIHHRNRPHWRCGGVCHRPDTCLTSAMLEILVTLLCCTVGCWVERERERETETCCEVLWSIISANVAMAMQMTDTFRRWLTWWAESLSGREAGPEDVVELLHFYWPVGLDYSEKSEFIVDLWGLQWTWLCNPLNFF